jgi:hypothetical protein
MGVYEEQRRLTKVLHELNRLAAEQPAELSLDLGPERPCQAEELIGAFRQVGEASAAESLVAGDPAVLETNDRLERYCYQVAAE